MRILRQASPEQLRLGWLRVIAGLVGAGPRPFDKLRSELAPQLDACERWLSEAGFVHPPRGNVPKSRVDGVVRMGVNYGIQSEETTTLTDLGQVLRTVAPWSPESTDCPLVWRGAARWIGFSIVLQAAGDVLIPLLRTWRTVEQTTAEVAGRLVELLSLLANQGGPEERGILHRQAQGAKTQGRKFQGRDTVYPYVEPLRDLGYLERTTLVGAGGGYRFTEAGARLRDALRRFDGDTEALLRSGISRVFLMAEGIDGLRPAPGYVLAEVLATIPPELTVLRPEEVPLEPAVLLAQAKLLQDAPGAWIDRSYAHAILKAMGHRGVKVELKRGDSELELNVAWEGSALLADRSAWNVDVEVHDPFTKEIAVEPAPAFEPAPPRDAFQADEDQEDTAEFEGNDTTFELKTEYISDDPEAMLRADVAAPLRLWLQYVDHLLAPPVSGAMDLARWGGLSTAIARIRGLFFELSKTKLEEKRSLCRDVVLHPRSQKPERKPPCLRPVVRLQRLLGQVHEGWLGGRIAEIWLQGDKEARPDPLPSLERGLRQAPSVARQLRALVIDAFLERTDDTSDPRAFWGAWDAAREATRSILHDAIAEGAWSSRSLRARLHRGLRRQDAREASRRWLDLLFESPRDARYIQRRRLPLDICDRLDLDELKQNAADAGALNVRVSNEVSDDGARVVEIDVRVLARSTFEARMKGRQRVQTLLVERYAERVAPEPDEQVDLHERLDHEHVEFVETTSDEHVDREEPDEGQRGLPGLSLPGLSHPRPPVGRQTTAGAKSVLRGEASVALQRVTRARRELIDARRPGLRGEQRVMLAWIAMERLVTAGKDGKGEAVSSLGAAASLIHLRGEMARILCHARAGLWLTASQQPEDERVQSCTGLWLSDLPEDKRTLLAPDMSEAVRRARAMDTLPPVDDAQALRLLWERRSDIPTLRETIRPWAPLAAAGLHDFLVLTGDHKDQEQKTVGDGRKLAEYFHDTYEDIGSFFAHVYEVRNRAVHGGGAFEMIHDPEAVEVYQRFIALAEPVLDAAERWVGEGLSLEQIWGLAIDKAQDLAGLPHDGGHGSEEPVSSRPSEPGSRSAPGGVGKGQDTSTRKQASTPAGRVLRLERLVELLSF